MRSPRDHEKVERRVRKVRGRRLSSRLWGAVLTVFAVCFLLLVPLDVLLDRFIIARLERERDAIRAACVLYEDPTVKKAGDGYIEPPDVCLVFDKDGERGRLYSSGDSRCRYHLVFKLEGVQHSVHAVEM